MPFNSETAKRAKSLQKGRGENKVNRLVKDVWAQVFNDLQNDPEDCLEVWARANKKEFYSLVTKLIPVQMDHAGEIIQRLIIEDLSHCEPLNIQDESNPGIQGQPKSLPLPQIQGNS